MLTVDLGDMTSRLCSVCRLLGGVRPGYGQCGAAVLFPVHGSRLPAVLLGIPEEEEAPVRFRRHGHDRRFGILN